MDENLKFLERVRNILFRTRFGFQKARKRIAIDFSFPYTDSQIHNAGSKAFLSI